MNYQTGRTARTYPKWPILWRFGPLTFPQSVNRGTQLFPRSSSFVVTLPAFGRGANCCDEHVYLYSVCQCQVREVSISSHPNFTKFSARVLPVTVARSHSSGLRYDIYFRFCVWRHISHNWPYDQGNTGGECKLKGTHQGQAARIYNTIRILELTHQGQHRTGGGVW